MITKLTKLPKNKPNFKNVKIKSLKVEVKAIYSCTLDL